MVFTTLPADTVSADEVLEGYRLRWQIKLTFKRLKSIIQLGHIPKMDDLFPPGAMSTSPGQRPRSNWREFQFAFHQVQAAIMPLVGLKSVLRQWSEISAALRERSPSRKPQIQSIEMNT